MPTITTKAPVVLSTAQQKVWVERNIPHRVRAALALSNRLHTEFGVRDLEVPSVDPIQRHCVKDSTWEGRLVALRWLIELIGIKQKNGKPVTYAKSKEFSDIEVRIDDLKAYGGKRFDAKSADAPLLADAWKACCEATCHVTIEYAGKPSIRDTERERALKIVVDYLSATIYKNRLTWLKDLVLTPC